jgi:hypothetical protein
MLLLATAGSACEIHGGGEAPTALVGGHLKLKDTYIIPTAACMASATDCFASP